MKSYFIITAIIFIIASCNKNNLYDPENYAGKYICSHYGYYFDTLTASPEFSHYYGQDTLLFTYHEDDDYFDLQYYTSTITLTHNAEEELTYRSDGTDYYEVSFYEGDSVYLYYKTGVTGSHSWYGKMME